MHKLTPMVAPAIRAGLEWDNLYEEMMSLRQRGDYAGAVVVAKRALEVAEANVGSNHPDFAASLNNLAMLYNDQGQYVQAKTFLEGSYAIYEKVLGPDDSNVAASVHNLFLLDANIRAIRR